MSSLPEEVIRYYERGLEATRFSHAPGELEFARTKQIIRRYLPEPPARVLDVGGGPGAYAQWLVRAGFEVHLVDAIPLHAQQARQASERQPETAIASITVGDARQLHYPSDFAHVVLLLGPLYHLTERYDRVLALQETFRVLKPRGLLVSVAISRYASTLAGLVQGFLEDECLAEICRRTLRDGQHRNPTGAPGHFTMSFHHRPSELRDEVEQAGFHPQTLLPIEGAAVLLQDLEEQWQDPVPRKRTLQVLCWLEQEPTILGVTGHIAAVAHKPA